MGLIRVLHEICGKRMHGIRLGRRFRSDEEIMELLTIGCHEIRRYYFDR